MIYRIARFWKRFQDQDFFFLRKRNLIHAFHNPLEDVFALKSRTLSEAVCRNIPIMWSHDGVRVTSVLLNESLVLIKQTPPLYIL